MYQEKLAGMFTKVMRQRSSSLCFSDKEASGIASVKWFIVVVIVFTTINVVVMKTAIGRLRDLADTWEVMQVLKQFERRKCRSFRAFLVADHQMHLIRSLSICGIHSRAFRLICGERNREQEEKGDTWHRVRVERSSGKFMRRFRLPENAKAEQVKAAMENGVLTVTVPKEDVKKPDVKSIQISELSSCEKPVDHRKLAGLILKSASEAKEQNRIIELFESWLSLDVAVIMKIKTYLLQSLFSPWHDASSTASQDHEGQTPLHYAAVCERESIAKFLVKEKADMNIKDDDNNRPCDLCDLNWPWMQHTVTD
ncbi:hypothetical protein POM88_041991 [Heracleum sosnowskyi]|uniref:SHSP domain-containing protein n=1 Tax=Heracleum sosnowskyi TaxID=360622 RepID=A0AAD8HI55_9APIA|nr:hypothetical protein POM88_041991 [Heracleum sosnowskyi]